MMALEYPLAELELTRTGKRKATYAVRSVAVGLAFAAVTFAWIVTLPMPMSPTETMSFLGEVVAVTARLFQFFAVFIVAPLVTAGLVAQEKQDRTLGLLLMADMGGRDIFLSKYLAAFLYVELLSLSALPILAIASFLGGISVPAMALQVFLLTIAATATCAFGLAFSTISRRPTEALFYTIIFEALWFAGTLMVGATGLIPGHLNIVVAAWAVDNPTLGALYWFPGAVFALAIAAAAALFTMGVLPRQVHDRAVKGRKRRFRRAPSPTPAAPHAATRPQTAPSIEAAVAKPAGKLVWAGAPGLPILQWPMPLRILVALALIPLGFFPCLGNVFIFVLIAYDITSSLWSSRRDGSMDSLFVTSMDDKTLTNALTRTYLYRSLLWLPAIVFPGIVYGGFRVIQHTMGAIEFAESGLFLGAFPIWLVGVFSGACYLLVPVTRFFLYWAMGCWASTLSLRPAGQTIAAAAIILGIKTAIYMLGFAVNMFGNVLAISFEQTLIMEGISAVAVTFTTAITNIGLVFLFRHLFVVHVGRRWRTGIAQPARPSA